MEKMGSFGGWTLWHGKPVECSPLLRLCPQIFRNALSICKQPNYAVLDLLFMSVLACAFNNSVLHSAILQWKLLVVMDLCCFSFPQSSFPTSGRLFTMIIGSLCHLNHSAAGSRRTKVSSIRSHISPHSSSWHGCYFTWAS